MDVIPYVEEHNSGQITIQRKTPELNHNIFFEKLLEMVTILKSPHLPVQIILSAIQLCQGSLIWTQI